MTFGSRIACSLALALAGNTIGAALSPDRASALPAAPNLTFLESHDPLSGLFHLQQYNDSTESSPAEPSYDPDRSERDPRLSNNPGLDDGIARGVASLITRGSNECRSGIRPEYRFDCLKNVLARAASTIDNRPGYREAARELRSLSRKLDGIVSKYQDTGAPRAKKGRRSYRAVAQESLARANREAAAAIDETVTKLLRSAGNSEKRKAHYSQIATAVGSTKRLLRS
ncbi:hypothetical protein [Roseibium sp.]|uniref:hypothetical protein n=1 Tax=Roseibium sp. TaxID=1936156 RepID=UPI003BAEC0D6